MNDTNENKDIKSLVLEKIQSGKINMRSHFYFVFGVTSLIVVAILILLISSLLMSFIFFSLIGSGKLFLLGFGFRGFMMFLILFPWSLLIIEIVLIVLLEWLIKKFKFGYHSSLSRLVFVILVVSILIGAIIDTTSLHKSVQHRAEQGDLPLPFVGDFYRGIRRPPRGQDIFRGVVSGVGTSSFILSQRSDYMENVDEHRYVIILPPGTSNVLVPNVGDTVFVAGMLLPGNEVQAYGFQKFSSSDTE